MKKVNLFGILLMSVLILSCGDSLNKEACLRSVQEAFPRGRVYTLKEGSVEDFVVIDSTNVYMVKTSSVVSSEITRVIPLFRKEVSTLTKQ